MLSRSYPFDLLCLTLSVLFSQAWAEPSGSWGPWSECSKSCEGVQHQEWQCGVENTCENVPTKTRTCNAHGCITQEMWIAIAAIGAVVFLLLIAVLIICIRRCYRKEKFIRKQKKSRYPKTVENGRDNSRGNSRKKSFHRFPASQKSQFTEVVEKEQVQKTEELRSLPPSSYHSNGRDNEAMNTAHNAPPSVGYRESIQQTQVIFGPDEPGDIGSILDSSTTSTETESESSDDNDGNVFPKVVQADVIHINVGK